MSHASRNVKWLLNTSPRYPCGTKGVRKMKRLEKLDDDISAAQELLNRAERAKQEYLKRTVCSKRGCDNENIMTGCWECKRCGRRV